MEFLHTDFWGGSESVAVVVVDAQCNVLLLSDLDFAAYRRGGSFTYHGGWATHSPVRLVPPYHGHWHLVVDLGGGAGRVKAQMRITRAAALVP